MKSKRVLVIISAILAITVIAVILGGGKKQAKPEIIKTAVVSKGDLKSYLSTNAVVKSKDSRSYTGAAQIAVKTVNVKVGDQVKKGQVMLTYDITDLNTSVSQARIQYNNAVLQRKELGNQKKQIDDNLAYLDKQIKTLEESKNPADSVQLQTLKQKRDSIQPISSEKIQLSDNSVALSKLTLDSAKAKLDKYKDGLIAEADGVVTSVNASEGLSLSPSQPAVIVQQLDKLKAVVSLGKFDSTKVMVGQEAIIKNADKLYKGTVSFISPAAAKTVSATGQTVNIEAEIDILDGNSEIKVDFDVNVDILLGSASDALKIPVECIKYDKSGKSYAFRVEGEAAKQVEVKLGIQSDMEAQVLEGLTAGDSVILNPSLSIKDGTIVKTNEGDKK